LRLAVYRRGMVRESWGGTSRDRIDARSHKRTEPRKNVQTAQISNYPLRTLPGLSRSAAEVILAAIGTDRTASPTAGHLCWWAAMSPGNPQRAGQRSSGRTTTGSPWLRSVLVQAAWSARPTKKTWRSVTYPKLARRIGKERAVVAVGPQILKVVSERVKGRTDDPERLGSDQAA